MSANETARLVKEYGDEIFMALLPNILVQCAILFIGIIGNLVILILYCTKMKQELIEPRYFIPVLAFYDLLACASNGVHIVIDSYMWISYFSNILCKTLIFTTGNTIMTSSAFLMTIAIQRYVKICRPLGKQMTLFWRRTAVILVIFANLVYCLPMLVLSGTKGLTLEYKNQTISGPSCYTGNDEYPLLERLFYGFMIVVGFIYILLTSGFYSEVACVIYRRFYNNIKSKRKNTNFAPDIGNTRIPEVNISTVSRSQTSVQNRRKTNFSLMFFIIITVYLVSNVPMSVMIAYVTTQERFWISISLSEFQTYHAISRLYVINHAANPFIYAYFDTCLREKIVSTFHKKPKAYNVGN